MTTENKTARLDGDDILFMVIGNGSRDNGMSLYHKADANLEKSGDKQSAELLGKVIDHLVKSLALDSKEQSALAYIINGIKASDHPENGSARNMIFKAANVLGMHLPSSMFASAGNDRNLRDQIVKLASEHPELREHLVPILKEAMSDGVFVVFARGGSLDCRAYGVPNTGGWKEFVRAGNKVYKDLIQSSQRLIKTLGDEGLSYEFGADLLSQQPFYLALRLKPSDSSIREVDYARVTKAVKAAGLKLSKA